MQHNLPTYTSVKDKSINERLLYVQTVKYMHDKISMWDINLHAHTNQILNVVLNQFSKIRQTV